MRYKTRDSLPLTLPTLKPATTPAEERLGTRDAARLLISSGQDTLHSQMLDLDQALRPGDLLVVNRSQTVAAGP